MNVNKYDRIDTAIEFIRNIANETNKNLVLGLSGGIDSALVLVLSVQAVGSDRVKVFMLPYKENQNLIDAWALATEYKVEAKIISITNIVDAFGCEDSYSKGNIMARVRMTILYEKALEHNALVLGTTNLSEYYLGYFTKWGDGASDLEPIMNMTKTEVFEFAKFFELPKVFLTKKPSADLWDQQTDEDEMGLTYAEVDKIIELYYNQFNSMNPIEKFENFLNHLIYSNLDFVDKQLCIKFRNRYISSLHKLNPIPSNLRPL